MDVRLGFQPEKIESVFRTERSWSLTGYTLSCLIYFVQRTL